MWRDPYTVATACLHMAVGRVRAIPQPGFVCRLSSNTIHCVVFFDGKQAGDQRPEPLCEHVFARTEYF